MDHGVHHHAEPHQTGVAFYFMKNASWALCLGIDGTGYDAALSVSC
jgi:hypothetical protein